MSSLLDDKPITGDKSSEKTEDKSLNKDEVFDLLGENDDEKEEDLLEEDKEDEEKDEGDKEKTEKDEKIEIDEEPDEDKLELTTPVPRKQILAKYPNLFKEFPHLEHAYYREQKYTELLPTIEDAQQAVAKSETLDKFEQDLMGGNTEKVLKAVKDADEDSWNKIIDDYLPTLSRVDVQAYHHVVGNVIRHTIIGMVKEAQASDNDVLKQAAQILNQYAFGSSEFRQPTNLSKQETKDTQIEERQQAITRREFERSRDDLNTRVSNVLRSTIDANIDPKDSMTSYVKKNATREAIESLTELISQDSRFRIQLDKLWEQVFKEDFSKSSLDKVKSAYLSKAKTLLPSVIKKSRNEALKGLGKKITDDSDENNEPEKKGRLPVGRSTSPSNISGKKPGEVAKTIPKGMKSIDYLMQD